MNSGEIVINTPIKFQNKETFFTSKMITQNIDMKADQMILKAQNQIKKNLIYNEKVLKLSNKNITYSNNKYGLL